jgi:hypothetical protein
MEGTYRLDENKTERGKRGSKLPAEKTVRKGCRSPVGCSQQIEMATRGGDGRRRLERREGFGGLIEGRVVGRKEKRTMRREEV